MHVQGGVKILSFENISLEVRGGSMLAITGPSGVGKSSLLKCVYRTYAPSSGRVMYATAAGEEVDLAAADDWTVLNLRRAEIGYVSQFFRVLPRVSALETLTEPLIARGVPDEDAARTARSLLGRVGLERTLWDMYPATFSGGEKQRLNILRAVITKPRLLLLDEPTASLDRGYKGRVVDLLLELKASGAAMLGVFHDYDALSALADDRYDMEARDEES